ncbi:MAG: ABC transporter substrate-binding protein [Halieaceae bacterium]|nr:ABC transporter substrate-binding protein [Halieaceae bacterium]
MICRGRLLTILLAALLAACTGDTKPARNADGLAEVILQTDWYAQPEHGGFYQALAKGFYAEEGLAVEIRPGANMNSIAQLVALNRVQFAVGATESLMIHRSRGIPLISLFPYFQHDPQCVLFHPESGIRSLEDLDGREVMLQPGLIYTEFLTQSMGLELSLIPMDWSLARFLNDKEHVQQCFLTSEPVVLRRRGVEPGVIAMSESGFDPYRHVYSNEALVAEQPELVAAFIRASIRGWRDFMTNDPGPAFALIMQNNPQQTVDLMQDTLAQMKRYNLTEGDTEAGEELGQYNLTRISRVIAQLNEIGMLERPVTAEESIALSLLPESLVVGGGGAIGAPVDE